MDDYESLSHTRWECKYHVVFIAEYRRKVCEFTAPAELRLQAAKTAAALVHPALAVTAQNGESVDRNLDDAARRGRRCDQAGIRV